MAGLGFDSGYGKPISESFSGAVQTATGLGRMRAEQQKQAQAQQMQALWQQSGGDWAKFKEAGGTQFLSPDLVQRMDAQEQAARRQQEQFDAQMLSRGLDRAATVANQEATREDTSAWRAAQEARWNADRVSKGVDSVRDALRYEEDRRVKEAGGNMGARSWTRTRLDGREKVFEEWNPEAKQYVEVSRGPAAASDLIGGESNPLVVTAARKIIAGEVPPEYYTKRGMSRYDLTQAIENLAPGTNITELQAQFKFRQDAPTNRSVAVLRSIVRPVLGKGGKVDSILDKYKSAHEALSMSQYPIYNSAKMFALEQTGDKRVKEYTNLRTAIGMEVGQALGAAALTDKRLEVELENLSKAASPDQAEAIVNVIRDLVEARLSQFEKEQGRPDTKADAPIAPAGTTARLKDGRVVTSDGKGGWN
jgi:hypothetical protein